MSRKPDFVDPITGKEFRFGGYTIMKKPPQLPLFGATANIKNDLPPSVDLRPLMTPVEFQDGTNSCTANVLAGSYEFLIKKAKGLHVDVSRLFIYYNGRLRCGFTEQYMPDAGCNIGAAIEALKEFGCCKESIYPFVPENLNRKPPKHCYQEALNHRVTDSAPVPVNLMSMKACLAEGYPFAFGFLTYESFRAGATNGGRINVPDFSNETMNEEHGTHAMLAVGYSDTSKCFIARNSWGSNWGDHGYCYIPYDYLSNPAFCLEVHVIKGLSSINSQRSSGDKIENKARWYHYDPNYYVSSKQRPVYYPDTFFWIPEDNFNYMTAIWRSGQLQSSTSNKSYHYTPVILWMDVRNEEHINLERELKKKLNVTIQFCEKFSEGTDYLLTKQFEIKPFNFQIICHGIYRSENKTPLDLLLFLDHLQLANIPVTVFTSNKAELLRSLEERSQLWRTYNWEQRLFITVNPHELMDRVKQNLT